MSLELVISILAIIVAPVLSLLGVWILARNNRKNAAQVNQAAVTNAEAAARNATSAEFGVLSEGWRGTFERQDRELKELREKVSANDAWRHEVLEAFEAVIEHIDILEDLVPNPPGAPPRPDLPESIRRWLRSVL